MSATKILSERRRTRLRFSLRRKAAGRPRLSVFRSGKHIYAQIIDDSAARAVVDDLGVDVLARTEHRQARTPRSLAAQREAQTGTPTLRKNLCRAHYFFLPSLRRIASPTNFTP